MSRVFLGRETIKGRRGGEGGGGVSEFMRIGVVVVNNVPHLGSRTHHHGNEMQFDGTHWTSSRRRYVEEKHAFMTGANQRKQPDAQLRGWQTSRLRPSLGWQGCRGCLTIWGKWGDALSPWPAQLNRSWFDGMFRWGYRGKEIYTLRKHCSISVLFRWRVPESVSGRLPGFVRFATACLFLRKPVVNAVGTLTVPPESHVVREPIAYDNAGCVVDIVDQESLLSRQIRDKEGNDEVDVNSSSLAVCCMVTNHTQRQTYPPSLSSKFSSKPPVAWADFIPYQ